MARPDNVSRPPDQMMDSNDTCGNSPDASMTRSLTDNTVNALIAKERISAKETFALVDDHGNESKVTDWVVRLACKQVESQLQFPFAPLKMSCQ